MGASPYRRGSARASALRALFAALLGAAAIVDAAPAPEDFAFAEPYFETIGDRDTVPSGAITALAQDRTGLFWIGTLSGLIRYDGYQFRRFAHDASDANSLSANNIRAIVPMPDGTLWVACEDRGLARYDPAHATFARLQHRDGDAGSLASDAVLALARDARGGIWVGTVNAGLDYLAPDATTFTHFPVGDDAGALHVRTVRRLLVDRRGDLWIAGIGGLDRLRAGANAFEHVAADAGDPDRLAGHYAYALFEARDGRLWIGLQDDGAAVVDPATLALKRLRARPAAADGLSHAWIDAIAEPRPGEIWLASFGGGIDVVDADSGATLRRVHANLALGGTLAVDRVTQLLVDRSGLLWIGTWGGGLQRHNGAGAAFRTLRFDPTRADSLGHPTILSALELPDRRIWLGTGGRGIDVLDRRRGIISHLPPDAQRPGALRDGIVLGLARTIDGTLWVGTQQSGLYRHAGGETFRAVAVPGRFRRMLAARSGTLIVGTENGLYEIDPRSDVATRLRGADGGALDLAIWALAEDASGNLWVGTPFGLFRRAAGAATLIRIDAGEGALADVQDLLVDPQDRLWVATSGGVERLLRIDGARAAFAPFPNFHAPVARLLADANGRLWSARYLLDPRDESVYEFGRADGVDIGNSPEISHGATTSDGLLLFGGTAGLLIVDPARFAPWRYAPPLVVSALRVDGAARADLRDGVRLQPGDKQFAVEFAALDFSAPERNRYRYRLDGYDERWIDADASRRVATYTNLAPGAYTLRVQGSNRAGMFSPHQLDLPVVVAPAIWQRAPFRIASVLFLLGLTWPLYRARLAVLHARQRELERVVDERTTGLREAHAKLESAYARIEQLSRTDTLTGVGNRRSIDLRLPALLALIEGTGAAGVASARLAFYLLDLDRFKAINDEHGHPAGDAVLRALGLLLRGYESDHVLATRWGGEEFLLVARVADEPDALVFGERLRGEIARLRVDPGGGGSLAFTASIGCACHPFDAHDPRRIAWERVIDLADLALYAAKRDGRNRVVGVRAARRLDGDFEQRLRAEPQTLFADGTLQLLAPGAR